MIVPIFNQYTFYIIKMKYLLPFLLSFSLNGSNPHSASENNIIISYKTEFKVKKSHDYKKKELMKLFINPKGSLFIDNKLLLWNQTSRSNLPIQEKTGKLMLIGASYFRFYLVKDYTENSTTFIEEHLNRQYNAYRKPSLSPESWTIISDKDSTISGLQVYKAECFFGGRTWEAWFTPEIAVSDGPYKFSGLPGLILKLESADGDYSFHISGIERQVPTEAMPVIPDYQVIDESRFKETQQMILENPFVQFQSKGITIEGNITVVDKVMTQDEFALYLKKEREDIVQLEK